MKAKYYILGIESLDTKTGYISILPVLCHSRQTMLRWLKGFNDQGHTVIVRPLTKQEYQIILDNKDKI